MLNCSLQRADLQQRIDNIRLILAATNPPPAAGPNISRESRGLSILLLYASYENLLRSLCRSLLETAIRLRAGNRRLQPGLKVFAAFNHMQSATQVGPTKLWRERRMDLVQVMTHASNCTINTDVFPDDGTNMQTTQLTTFCKVFALGDPAPILKEVWSKLDTIVKERNGVAHGSMTADEVGRRYSVADLTRLVDLWEKRWNEFLDWVEVQASTRDFFLLPR